MRFSRLKGTWREKVPAFHLTRCSTIGARTKVGVARGSAPKTDGTCSLQPMHFPSRCNSSLLEVVLVEWSRASNKNVLRIVTDQLLSIRWGRSGFYDVIDASCDAQRAARRWLDNRIDLSAWRCAENDSMNVNDQPCLRFRCTPHGGRITGIRLEEFSLITFDDVQILIFYLW